MFAFSFNKEKFRQTEWHRLHSSSWWRQLERPNKGRMGCKRNCLNAGEKKQKSKSARSREGEQVQPGAMSLRTITGEQRGQETLDFRSQRIEECTTHSGQPPTSSLRRQSSWLSGKEAETEGGNLESSGPSHWCPCPQRPWKELSLIPPPFGICMPSTVHFLPSVNRRMEIFPSASGAFGVKVKTGIRRAAVIRGVMFAKRWLHLSLPNDINRESWPTTSPAFKDFWRGVCSGNQCFPLYYCTWASKAWDGISLPSRFSELFRITKPVDAEWQNFSQCQFPKLSAWREHFQDEVRSV